MKIVRCEKDGKVFFGKMCNDTIYKIDGDIFGDFSVTEEMLKREEVKILPPVMPTKIAAVGLNYLDHIKEMGHDIPKTPVFFLKPSTAVIGEGESIVIPKMSERVDYEAELGVVIKKKCKNVSAEKADEYILGFTCLNDVTARDLQKIDGQWTRAKGFDTFCPIGPCIETEADANNLKIELRLNGEVRQSSCTSNFLWKAEQLVSFVSNVMTLNPGDIVSTGTTSGIGQLKKGDRVEVEIEKIGILTNYVTESENE